jgi:serralysin
MTTISNQVRQEQRLRALAGGAGAAARVGATQAGAVQASSVVTLSAVAQGASVARGAAVVDYTDRIKASANKNVNALLAGGNRWFHTAGASGAAPAASARHELTYSFIENASGLNAMDASGFQALSNAQRSVVTQALGTISDVVDVHFTQVASGGDIQFGSNNQASSAGYARYPNEGSQVFLANNQGSFSGSWAAGSYEWETVLHETAHAMGLKHPGNYNAGGGGTQGPYLSTSADHRGNTIMSYHDPASLKRISFNGSGFSTSSVNPSSLQAYDVAALQYLYGAPASSSATTYSWASGAAFSQTIWNNNGASSIDLSNQTGSNTLDLRAGKYSSIAVRDAYADMGPYNKTTYAALTSGGRKLSSLIGVPGYTGTNNLYLAAGTQINNAKGGSGADTIVTNSAGNTVDAGAGNDAVFYTGGNGSVSGGEGDDTVYLVKKAGTAWALSADGSTATWTQTNSRTHVTTTLATLSLAGVEHVKFWNGSTLKSTGVALVA